MATPKEAWEAGGSVPASDAGFDWIIWLMLAGILWQFFRLWILFRDKPIAPNDGLKPFERRSALVLGIGSVVGVFAFILITIMETR